MHKELRRAGEGRGYKRPLGARFRAASAALLLALLLPAAQAAVSLSKQFLADTGALPPATETQVTGVNQGDFVVVKITVLNSGNPVTAGSLSDALPAGMTLAPNPTPVAQSGPDCGAPSFTAVPNGASFGAAGVQVPAQVGSTAGSCSVYVRVRVTGPTGAAQGSVNTITNTLAVGAFNGTDAVAGAVSNATPASQSIQVTKLQNLTVGKSFSPSTVAMGENSTIAITVTNPNAGSAAVLGGIGENLPANVTALNATPTVTCSGAGSPNSGSNNATASGTTGNTTITFAAGTTIAGGGTCTVTWPVRGSVAAGNSVTNTNTVPANSIPNDRGLTDPAATANLTTQSPLALGKAFSASPVRAGQNFNLTFTLANRSGFALSGVAFADTLPTASGGGTLTVSGASTNTCAGALLAAGASVSLTGAALAANQSCTITVPVVASADGVYNNTTGAPSYTSANPLVASTQTPNTASASVTAFTQTTGSKTASVAHRPGVASGSVAPGNQLLYQITLNNFSPSAQNNVQIVDPLPISGAAQLTLVSAATVDASSNAGCAINSTAGVGTGTATLNVNLPSGSNSSASTCVFDFEVQVPSSWPVGTAVVNTIPLANITQGGNPFGQNTPLTVSTPAVARITAAKSVAQASIFQGTTTTVTLTLTNHNYTAISNAAITDTPIFGASAAGEVRIAAPANAVTTCGGAPVITAVPGTTSFAVSGLTIPARTTAATTSCSVSFDVQGVVPGNYTNTVPAASISGTNDGGDGPVAVNPPAAVSAALAVTPTLSAAKTFSPASVAASGGVARVTLQLNNIGPAQLTGVAATDPLPAGMALASPPNASTTCAGTPTIAARGGASTARLSGATLPAGGNCLFQFDVRTTGSGSTVNTIPAGNITANNNVATTTPVSATLGTFTAPPVTVVKTFAPSSLATVGQVSLLTIAIANNQPGTIALTNLGLTDNLPAGLVLAPSPALTTTCPGGVVTGAPGGSAVSLAGGTLAAGASCSFTANVTLVTTGTANNTIPVGAVSNNQNVSNTQPFTANLQTQASLGVTKAFVPPNVQVNVASQLQITVINSQAITLNSIAVADTLPAGLQVASPSAAGTTCSGGAVSTTATHVLMTGATLQPAVAGTPTTCLITVNVVATTAGTFVNTLAPGTATAVDPSGNAVQNQAPASTATLQVRSPATVTKAFANANRVPGQPDTLTITIANPNTIALTGALLADNLPANVFVANVPNASTSCAGGFVTASSGAASLRLTQATIAANGSCTVQVDVVSNVVGTFVNTIPDSALVTNEGITNPTPASAQFTTLNPPTLGKTFNPVQIGSGGTSKLRIVLGNPNAVALTLSAALTDNLPQSPGPLTVPSLDAATADPLPRCANASRNATSVTIASGTSIPPGGCVVIANVSGTVDGAYSNQIAASALQTNGGVNQLPATAPLAISSTLAALTGTIYQDNNNNGVVDAGEPGIAGQTVQLLDSGGNVVATTTTDAVGNYAFIQIAPGTYSVREPGQPPGTLNGTTTAGRINGTPAGTGSGVATTPSQISAITLAGGQISSGNNFGEIVASQISGQAFLDANNDGVRQSTEASLSGVAVTLSGSNDLGPIAPVTVVTAADGSYSFTGLRPGSYTVTEGAQPANSANGITTAGSVLTLGTPSSAPGGAPGTATPTSVLPSAIAAIQLPSHASSPNNNFAEIPTSRNISGRIFGDQNNDGLLDGTDAGVGGLTVTLTGTDANGNPVSATTVTAVDGSYSFAGLPAGTYGLSYSSTGAPVGTVPGQSVVGSTGGAGGSTPATRQTLTGINLTGLNNTSTSNNFTLRPPGQIGGFVYLDRNNNGLYEPGANPPDLPLAGVTVTLSGTDYGPDGIAGTADDVAVNLTTTTAADGSYAFRNLRPGNYTLTEPTQPAGTGNGITSAGTIAGTTVGVATPLSVVPSAIAAVVLPASGNGLNYNFGEIPSTASIAGEVWLDANANGLLDPSETGIANVTINLTGTDVNSAAVSRTTTTDAQGRYSFTNLLAGTYTLTEPNQPPGTYNGATLPGSSGGTATPTSVTPSAIGSIALAGAQASINNNFGEIPTASIAGSVYNDNNNNGLRDTGEAGYPNQTITLAGTDNLGQPVSLTTTTDANGNYVFPGLRPGTYTVTQPTQPAGVIGGITSAGTAGGTATPVGTTPAVISAIVLGPGTASTANNFAEIGNSPDVVVTKVNTPATFTEQNRGSYTIRVSNIGQLPTSGAYTVTDTLPPGMTVVAGTAAAANPSGAGWACAVAGQAVTCTSSAVIAAGADNPNPITLGVQLGSNVCASNAYPCNLNNRVLVSGGGELPARGPQPSELANPPVCTQPVAGVPAATQNVCVQPTPIQQSGGLSGLAWLDVGHDRIYRPGTDPLQPGIAVELYRNGVLVGSTTTGANGTYQFLGLVPGPGYEVRFHDPSTGAYYGRPVSADPAGGNDPSATGPAGVVAGASIGNIIVPGGSGVRINQNLPLDPAGVVYDSQTRLPVAGAVVQLLGPTGAPVPAACVLGGASRLTTVVGQPGGVPGGYSFDLVTPAPAGCPGNGSYLIQVTPPSGYVNAGLPSDATPTFTSPQFPAQAAPASVPGSCQNYVSGGPCVVQAQAGPPAGGAPNPYFFHIPFAPATPGSTADITGNDIPLDPFGKGTFVVTKQAAKSVAELGDALAYTISVRSLSGPPLPAVRVEDYLPAGLRYIPGTYRLGGVLQPDPAGGAGPHLTFKVGNLASGAQVTFTYFVRVGVGAQQGDGINSAQGFSSSGAVTISSNVARAQIKVTGGVFSNDACIVGKVFVDCNNNQVQDPEELGIPGVRLYLEDGTGITTDSEGKFSLCGMSPRTHVLKLDPITLPRGSRLVTSSSRNAGDAGSLFVDLQNGELHRTDFIEGSCSNRVLEQVKARKSQGEVRATETEKKGGPALKFEGKAPNYPQQGTDGAAQAPVKPRDPVANVPAPSASSVPQDAPKP